MKNVSELLTELKQMEERNLLLEEQLKEKDHLIQELQTELNQANKINGKKKKLISQISHEVRTPLHVVIGMSSIAKEDLDNKERVRDNLEKIENSSRVLLGIIENILDASELAGGTFEVHAKKFDLREQLTNLGVFFYEHAKAKGIHFGIHIKGVSEEYLIGDEKRVQQILTNLFANVLRFTPEGGRVDLDVVQGSVSRNRVHMRFVFQNTGCAVGGEAMKEVFVPYEERVHINGQMNNEIENGLYVVKLLVDALGGVVEISDRPGDGGSITLDLPFEKTIQQEMNFEKIKDYRVLLVADERVCKERGNMLADMGVRFGMASDGYLALDVLGEAEERKAPYNVCMIDLNMNIRYPEILIQEIREVFGEEPIIIATTNTKGKAELARDAGADYVIDNTLFRSTIFDALMVLENGKIYQQESVSDIARHYDFSSKRILIVEDVALNMEVVVKLLSKVNASMVCAENGNEALRVYMHKPAGYFDCILWT